MKNLGEPREIASDQVFAGRGFDHQQIVDDARVFATAIGPSLEVESSFERRAGNFGPVETLRDRRWKAAFENLAEVSIGNIGRRYTTRSAVETNAREIDHLRRARIVAVGPVAHRRRA